MPDSVNITVFRDKFTRSWPQRDPDKPLRCRDRGYVLELGAALERTYSSDAHVSCYRTPNGWRLNRDCFEAGVAVEMTAIAFDLDGPGHEATPQWRAEVREGVRALSSVHPKPYYYETRGGCRIVYRLSATRVLKSEDDATRWARSYAVAVAYLARRFGLLVDPSCGDWQRLYRLPKATRDRGRPENWPIAGEPDDIGTLFIQHDPRDVEVAAETCRAFRANRRRYDFRALTGDGRGLLFRLLRARGDVLAERRDGWIVRCPNEGGHSTGNTGDSSTILYPPAPGRTLGAIHCKHAHCSGFTPQQWLDFFTPAEVQAAEQQAAA